MNKYQSLITAAALSVAGSALAAGGSTQGSSQNIPTGAKPVMGMQLDQNTSMITGIELAPGTPLPLAPGQPFQFKIKVLNPDKPVLGCKAGAQHYSLDVGAPAVPGLKPLGGFAYSYQGYAAAGSFQIKATGQHASCVGNATLMVEVKAAPKLGAVVFGNSGSRKTGEVVKFWLDGANNAQKDACKVRLDFGDGTNEIRDVVFGGPSANFQHVYAKPGAMTITAASLNFCRGSGMNGDLVSSKVDIAAAKLVSMSLPETGRLNVPVDFRVKIDGPQCNVEIDHGDGTKQQLNLADPFWASSSGVNLNHSFPKPGAFYVKVKGFGIGCQGDLMARIEIPMPMLNQSIPLPGNNAQSQPPAVSTRPVVLKLHPKN